MNLVAVKRFLIRVEIPKAFSITAGVQRFGDGVPNATPYRFNLIPFTDLAATNAFFL